jgi:hypothetical protein
MSSAEAGNDELTPLSGIALQAKEIAGSTAQTTLTDALGSFTFKKLPDGSIDPGAGIRGK